MMGTNLSFILFFATIIFGGFLFIQSAHAQYGSACSEYGIMAYESGGYCRCMAGYVMGENMFGDSSCISEDQACEDTYGYHAQADYGGGCKCSYGYVFDTNMFGDKQCVDGNQTCRTDHGYNSSYSSLSNSCECDNNYTFDENYQCVKKQNNVYFTLLDINPDDDKELLIKSNYDYSMYKVRVGIGCLSTTIERYLGRNLVINLGTDYYVDMFDTVVLQDDNQTCSIMYREKTYDDSFPEPEEEDTYYYTPISTHVAPTYDSIPESTPEPTNYEYTPQQGNTVNNEIINIGMTPSNQTNPVESTTTAEENVSPEVQQETPEVKVSLFRKIINFFINLF